MKYIYTLAIITFLASCDDSISDKAYIIESERTLSFNVEKDVYLYSRCYKYHKSNDTEYIAFSTNHYDKDYDEIVFFNLSSQKETHRVPVYRKGANSIGCELRGFDFKSLDTIVVTNKYQPKIFTIDNTGNILKQYSLKTKYATTYSMLSLINAPFALLKNGDIEFPQSVPNNRSAIYPNPPEFKFSDCPLAYIINAENGNETASKVSFPHLYDNDNNIDHNESFSRIYDGENFIYGFLAYDSLIVTSDHQTAKTYCAKSRHIGDIKNPGTPPGTSISDIMKTTLLAQYGNLIYDPYREVYYRFCYFENDYPGPYTLEYTLSGGAFTIMIIDKEFNVIGETVFPDKRYASKIFFVNKDGLWLSENHFLREDMTDDKLVFRCLKLEYF